MKNLTARLIILIGIVLILGSCATIISGTSQTINVQAVDANGSVLPETYCKVKDQTGMNYFINGNPGSVQISKNFGALIIECQKKGYMQGQISAGSSFNALTILNVLFWPGFIIDTASGAIVKYPSHYSVLMVKE